MPLTKQQRQVINTLQIKYPKIKNADDIRRKFKLPATLTKGEIYQLMEKTLYKYNLNKIKIKNEATYTKIKSAITNRKYSDNVHILPENTLTELRNVVHKLMGKSILLQYSDGNGDVVFNATLDVPATNFNKWWKSDVFNALMQDSMTDVFQDHSYLGKCVVIEGITNPKVADKIFQTFLDGSNYHCFIQPIYQWAKAQYDDAIVNKKSKQTKSRYNVIIQKLNKYAEEYKLGIAKTPAPPE